MEDEKKVTINNEDGDSVEINADLAAGKISDEILEEIANDDKNFETEIENLKTELNSKNERLLRLQADFDNFRKRTAKEKLDVAATVEQNFLIDLLPLLDNLSRATKAAEGEVADAETVRKGIEMIQHETISALEKHGLEAIDTQDKMFDPNFHQAVGSVQDETKEDGAIAVEFQRGYMAHGRVIRPSMVQVVNNG